MRAMPDTLAPAGMERAVVTEVTGPDEVLVRTDGSECVACTRLYASEQPALVLAPGDEVLVHRLSGTGGIVMGRIGPARCPVTGVPESIPDELVIEARTSLTLRVGDGSITIREDGRILIKGKDLVSHAKGMNRIRGGSVSVN